MNCNWLEKKLSDIIEFNPKESLPKGTLTTKIAMEDIQPFCRDISEKNLTNYTGGAKFRNFDTIMARITPCLENGKTAQVRCLKQNEIGFGSTEFIVMRAKDKISDPNFVYYLARSPYLRDIAIKSMVGSSGRQRVQIDVLKDTKLCVPSFEEQKIIGRILSSLDDKIELNNQINKNLEEQANTIFERMFPNCSQGNHSIGEYIIPKRGKNLLSRNAKIGEVPVIAGGLTPATYHNESNTVSPVVTISASGANAGFISLWNIPVWSSDSSFIDSSMTKNIYFWYVLLKKRQQEIYDSQTGSAQQHIYPQHITSMPVIQLTKNSIENFTKLVTPLFDKIGYNKVENNNIRKIRDLLLPKLISGEIDVTNINI